MIIDLFNADDVHYIHVGGKGYTLFLLSSEKHITPQ